MAHPVLTHLALHVRDLGAAVSFYERFCGLSIVHRRVDEASGQGVVWLAEPGKEREFILVFISGGPTRSTSGNDFSHLGFALPSRDAVDAVAREGAEAGRLVWPPREEPYPVGYYCGLKDPDGNFVEFSYGQPLGPGAEALDEARLSARGGYGQGSST
jgi:catechol 2,3-dioxygenase-like lactoylglutathione lyase family enzyme